jgi:hypothetical protein
MKDKERIQALKSTIDTAQVQLAELLKEPTAEERVPKAGDVWQYTSDYKYIIDEHLTGVSTCRGIRTSAKFGDDLTDCTYLGTFSEVYVLRSEVEKDYVSKEKIVAVMDCVYPDTTASHILSSLL